MCFIALISLVTRKSLIYIKIIRNLHYLPNPLCSSDEKDIMPSNAGAWLEITKSEKSGGEIDVILGWVEGYGSYSRTVM